MKIAYLGAGSSIHNQRWIRGLAERGVSILLLTQHEILCGDWGPGVSIERLPYSGSAGYVLNAARVRAAARMFGAELLHVHYATGYGLCGTLAGVRPRIVSVWGADVYDAPHQSLLHAWMVSSVLQRADAIFSTSRVMAEQCVSVAKIAHPHVVPFGIDTEKFRPSPQLRDDGLIVIGTVKTLEHKYGIDTLIRAFALLKENPTIRAAGVADLLRLRVVGGGSLHDELGQLAKSLGVDNVVQLVGPVPHDQVPAELNSMDIYVAVSRLDSESFGVAVLEACSCGMPVVVSDAGGLPEVVRDGVTGFVVERENPQALCEKLIQLTLAPHLRTMFGRAGRDHVIETYRWEDCLEQTLGLYRRIIGRKSS